jgi:transposase InsO family protein
MSDAILVFLRCLLSGCQSRRLLLLENLALRHQLTVLMRQARKPKLCLADRLLWRTLRRLWLDWQKALLLFQPKTVIAWHRLGFRLFWRWKSRGRGGRPSTDRKLIQLIRRMWSSNPTWGSKRIQAELAKLELTVSDSTIRKYRPRIRRGDQTWKTFLHNHAKDLLAVDFLVVRTATFRVLFVFLVLAHERRKVLHFNVTDSPSAAWTAQQLAEAFPYAQPPRYLLRDRDGIYGQEFVRRTRNLGLQQKLIAPRSPWQNPLVERLVGSIRRECLDHLIVLNEEHLRQRLTDYLSYYHQHRTHRALDEDCPQSRAVEPPDEGNIIVLPLVSGLHHRYARHAAA